MKGYLAIIAASLLYGIMPVLSKLLLLEGMNSSSIVVWRFCFSTVFCLAIMLIKKIPFQATPRQIGVMIVVGILGFGMTATLVTAAYNYIPVGLATMFQFSYPLFVLIIMAVSYTHLRCQALYFRRETPENHSKAKRQSCGLESESRRRCGRSVLGGTAGCGLPGAV